MRGEQPPCTATTSQAELVLLARVPTRREGGDLRRGLSREWTSSNDGYQLSFEDYHCTYAIWQPRAPSGFQRVELCRFHMPMADAPASSRLVIQQSAMRIRRPLLSWERSTTSQLHPDYSGSDGHPYVAIPQEASRTASVCSRIEALRLARLKVETPAPGVSRGILPPLTTYWWYDRLLQRIMFIFSSRNACTQVAKALPYFHSEKRTMVDGWWTTQPYGDWHSGEGEEDGVMSE